MELVLKNIYNDILELSDIEKQKEYWLGKNNNHISSFEEIMCRIFDDNDIELFIESEWLKNRLSTNTIKELIELIKLLNDYKEKESDEEILKDPNWDIIVNKAKSVLKKWNDCNN